MFGELLKNKNEIEEKVKRLQYKYLEQLKVYRIIEERNSKEIQTIKVELLENREILTSVMKECKETLCQLQELKSLILTTQSLSVNINTFLDHICITQGIELPEEILIKSSEIFDFGLNDFGEDESDKENSFLGTTEEYFSPNIQIRKSSGIEAYTPALRSIISTSK